MKTQNIRAAIIGARGYVGAELIRLLDQHPQVELVAAFSRQYEGIQVNAVIEDFSDPTLIYRADDLGTLSGLEADVIFLALPNGLAKNYRHIWEQQLPNTVIIDLSADFRFDADWCYGQPETYSADVQQARLIANPGCYATGAQLGLKPIKHLLLNPPQVFGVSGFSGAGTSPSDKNNPNVLKDNLLAYMLTDHIHEREVSHVLQQEIHFTPHVAPHFRGIHLTISAQLHGDHDDLLQRFQDYYAEHPLIQVQKEIPQVALNARAHHVCMGGFQRQGERYVWVVTLDNLLKGAATQAVQNMNLSLAKNYGLNMNTGVNYAV
ncbi:N-acetyl-gamma-glutamyl-phosphate reductase [Marinicella sp. W31]|uniref:N-acetyl-gamma-glutamyl-phosphate reductase n=1 Tax=Marinicella sp. W31 TaxID=3023713 RepID=UPI0037566BB5